MLSPTHFIFSHTELSSEVIFPPPLIFSLTSFCHSSSRPCHLVPRYFASRHLIPLIPPLVISSPYSHHQSFCPRYLTIRHLTSRSFSPIDHIIASIHHIVAPYLPYCRPSSAILSSFICHLVLPHLPSYVTSHTPPRLHCYFLIPPFIFSLPSSPFPSFSPLVIFYLNFAVLFM